MTTATDWTEYTPEGSRAGAPAKLGRRWEARVLDLGCWVAVPVAGHAFGYGTPVLAGATVLWALLWLVLPVGRGGATAGKWLAGIRVVRADGRPLTLGRAVLREGFVLASLAIPLIGLLNGLTGLNDPRHQGLHDKIFDTAVVDRQLSGSAIR